MTITKKKSTSGELMDLIKQLTSIRREHVRALEEIEETFKMFGLGYLLTGKGGKSSGPKGNRKLLTVAASVKKTKGKGSNSTSSLIKAAVKAGKGSKSGEGNKSGQRPRGTFAMTGDELILRFVRDKGDATTEQIRKHWEASGRGGKSDNNITNLVKKGKLLRNKPPTGLGSIYTVAPDAFSTSTEGTAASS